eukprot:CAMPEP_0176498482 /NCGR_PEP_ID=MMETSP0200_2-20121128/12344_1 /TAXON_ID=947934 /ORGANISM="Chaetoceros sp., Strain GSL56" /LENGTH=1008 /DNA_ID=CAMNT_0017896691 /DNA_START=815 /DNA_END=3841 /DNA_ORIENTATION=-
MKVPMVKEEENGDCHSQMNRDTGSLNSSSSSYQEYQHGETAVVAGYRLEQKLGAGSFASVYRAINIDHCSTNESDIRRPQYVAIKRIDRCSNKITQKVLDNLDLEISILTTYQHPNIVCLYQAHRTSQYFYLILEYCAGGDLQGLIRSRRSGRLTERLTRRLMRDLTAGLVFLASHNLIHRDIKPQNLLLTGPLPLDEVHDPARMEQDERRREIVNFPSNQFHLKIADFGFARHLHKTSLADTLCGSPLYMAPEILQHQRYDNKADLWSAGTVLFEMIAGRPPFHGENHMDLLKNIQRKRMTLPPDLNVSKECMKLLEILLERNPLSRAGFREFLQASDAFVQLGCNGEDLSVHSNMNVIGGSDVAGTTTASTANQQQQYGELGPITEEEEEPRLMASLEQSSISRMASERIDNHMADRGRGHYATSPALIPMEPGTMAQMMQQQKMQQQQQHIHAYNNHSFNRHHSHFIPLEPSPPGPKHMPSPIDAIPSLTLKSPCDTSCTDGAYNLTQHGRYETNSQHSDDSSGGFVMVDKGIVNSAISPSTSTQIEEKQYSRSPLSMWKQSSRRVVPVSALGGNASPPSSPRSNSSKLFPGKALLSTRNMIPPSVPFVRKGMLSTSPGTGGALVGFVDASQVPAVAQNRPNIMLNEKMSLDSVAKILSTADDVGRRAINVAHVGDTRAYLAMRVILLNESGVLNSTSMDVTEETNYDGANRARAISADQSHSKRSDFVSDNDEFNIEEEMPFAMPMEDEDPIPNFLAMKTFPFSEGEEVGKGECSKTVPESSNTAILTHFREALSCYMKTLSMLKVSVNATQEILKELSRSITSSSPSSKTESFLSFKNRCEVSHNWLSGQFKGVLERADAANTEIRKYTELVEGKGEIESNELMHVTSVEELIYNHSLACGKDGAVKQLLGQYENARSCYRSAGLLAETLLMEPTLVEEDKRTLEDYVQGFSDRIYEIDCLMLQQSRHSISSSSSIRGVRTSTISSRRNSSTSIVVPIVRPNN